MAALLRNISDKRLNGYLSSDAACMQGQERCEHHCGADYERDEESFMLLSAMSTRACFVAYNDSICEYIVMVGRLIVQKAFQTRA